MGPTGDHFKNDRNQIQRNDMELIGRKNYREGM